MKIVVGNNYFFLRGGAERVMFEEMALLNNHGHEVIPFSVRDPDREATEFDPYFVEPIDFSGRQSLARRAYVASRILYSFHSKKQAGRLLSDFQVDIGHFHNIYHRLNPAVFHTFSKQKVPVVVTAHDYKLLCPIYLLYRDGSICERCLDGHYINCVLGRCNRSSLVHSAVGALEGYIQKWMKLWTGCVTTFIVPSHFLGEKLVEGGFDRGKVHYCPNFVDSSEIKSRPMGDGYLLYFGRLSREKGVATLLQAMGKASLSPRLVIVGEGPERARLEEAAEGTQDVVFRGYLQGNELNDAIANSAAVIVPSEWYENAPMSVLEAMAHGKPVIGSTLGGIPEMIGEDGERGRLFEAGNVDELASLLAWIADVNNQSELREMGVRARTYVETVHSPERHYDELMAVYRSVI